MLTRRHFLRWLIAGPFLLPVLARARSELVAVRHSLTETRNRIVFEFDKKVTFSQAAIDNPPRFYLDVEKSGIRKGARMNQFASRGIIKSLRTHVAKDGKMRLVLDLRRMVVPEVSQWPTQDGRGDRIVVDFPMKAPTPSPPKKTPKSSPPPTSHSRRKRVVVMIDPGHGGRDPGAVGKKKTREKDVVLSISRKLHALLKKEPNIEPRLTRNRDIYLRLHVRTRLARRYDSGLFVSVHADAARRRSARGASVYAVSHRGATSAHARWMADRENAADLRGGLELADRHPVIQDVLFDMSQNAVNEYSLHAGTSTLKSLSRVGKLHSRKVERAGFAVLKSPDIPSILVETGFISNVQEEKLLRSSKHQQKIASALRDGIRDYLNKVPEYS